MRTILPVVIIILLIALATRRRRRAAGDGTSDGTSGGAASGAGAAGGGRVTVDDQGVTHVRADGGRESVPWSALRHIHVETVAGGLNAADVTWVLAGADGDEVRVSQTTTGADALIARLQQLEGFRYEPMIESMITTDATRFVVWERV